jgi:hypothetical protein
LESDARKCKRYSINVGKATSRASDSYQYFRRVWALEAAPSQEFSAGGCYAYNSLDLPGRGVIYAFFPA